MKFSTTEKYQPHFKKMKINTDSETAICISDMFCNAGTIIRCLRVVEDASEIGMQT